MAAPLPDKPDAASVMTESARQAKADTNVANPATATSFTQAKQTAAIRLAQTHAYREGAAGIARERPPDLPNVPVYFPGGQIYGMTWPVAVDDPGLAVICDRGLDEWKSTGAKTTEPQDLRRHDLSDAVFLPGVRSPATPLPPTAYDPAALVIYGTQLKLGDSTATSPITLEPLVVVNMTTLQAAISSAIAAACTSGAGGGTVASAFPAFASAFATAFSTALTAFPASMASSRVRSL